MPIKEKARRGGPALAPYGPADLACPNCRGPLGPGLRCKQCRRTFGRRGNLSQPGAAAVQGRLHSGNAYAEYLRRFGEGMAEHVHQQDAGALRGRQMQERRQA